jgi:hypothetical protein
VPLEFPSTLLEGLDRPAFDDLCRSTADRFGHNLKYGDLEFRMGKAWRDARQLGFCTGPPRSMFSISALAQDIFLISVGG